MAKRTLHIFVSGTIDDQRAERNTVGAAIESLHLDATRAETQYSSERCSRDECLEMVRECDIYLGVYNPKRYGWTIPSDGISVTELEFNEAQRLKKPTLIFVAKLPKDWKPKDDDEKQQREKQEAFLKRVLDQKAIATMEQLGDVYGLAQTFGNLGYLYQAQSDLKRALEYAEKALTIFKRLGAYETAQAEKLVVQLRKN